MSEPTTGAKARLVHGVIAPLFTPMRKDLSINEDAIFGLIGYAARTRAIDAVFARSGIGQIYSFTVEETKRFGVRVRDAVSGRMRLMLGCAGEWPEREDRGRPDPGRYIAQAVELTQYAARIGVDAAVHPLPVALAPKGDEPVEELVFRYYKTINDASSIAILIYQPPGSSRGYRLTPELIKRLATLPRIIGAKVSSSRDATMRPLLTAAKGTPFGVICGDEAYLMQGLEQGATGVIGIGTLVFPELHYAVLKRYWTGDIAGARKANEDLNRALETINPFDSKIPAKDYLRRKGVDLNMYTRGVPDLYGDYAPEPYTVAAGDRVEKVLDELRRKYRVEPPKKA